MARPVLLLVLVLAVLPGCKSTEDYLYDLHKAQDDAGHVNLAVYDSGTLIHEALSALVETGTLTLSQMGRAVYYSSLIIEKNEVPLLRADAAALLGRIGLYYPLPPRTEPLDREAQVAEVAMQQLEAITQATRLLPIPDSLIPRLESADLSDVEAAHGELVALTGQDVGRSADAWRAWWRQNEAGIVQRAIDDVPGPLRSLRMLHYESLGSARSVLGFVTIIAPLYQIQAVQEQTSLTVIALARRATVLAISKALIDPAASVRTAAALATQAIRDPELGPRLILSFQQEQDTQARAHLARALVHYPGRKTLAALILALEDGDPALTFVVRNVLVEMTAHDLGANPEDWVIWWQRGGEDLWK